VTEPRTSAVEGLEDLFAVLDRVPFVAGVKRDAGRLRRLLYERRPARLVVVGHGKSGRSTLLNLLMDRAVLPTGDDDALCDGDWIGVDAYGSRVSWLELSPGTDAALLGRAIREGGPDAVIALIEVEASDARATLRLARDLARDEGRVPVLVVLAQTDRVAPRRARELSRDLAEQATELGLPSSRVFSVSAPTRSGVTVFADALIEALPRCAQLESARAMPCARASRLRIAREIVRASGSLAVTVALVPLPLSDVAFLAPLQVAMVSSVAHLAGRAWDRETISEWAASVGFVGGAGFGMRWGAQQLVKLVPGAGSFISAGIAGAGTAALGKSAIAWFLEREV